MKIRILAICWFFFLFDISARLFAEAFEDSFFKRSIAAESLNIEHTSSYDYITLSDLYASRGEDYLILGENQKALADFLISYDYALKCQENYHLSFRSLFGAFLTYIHLENLESAQQLYVQLENILKDYACNKKNELRIPLSNSYGITNSFQYCLADYPILGPDRISVEECIDNVNGTAKAIKILIASVRKSEIRALAVVLIDQLMDTARNCCWAVGFGKAACRN